LASQIRCAERRRNRKNPATLTSRSALKNEEEHALKKLKLIQSGGNNEIIFKNRYADFVEYPVTEC